MATGTGSDEPIGMEFSDVRLIDRETGFHVFIWKSVSSSVIVLRRVFCVMRDYPWVSKGKDPG